MLATKTVLLTVDHTKKWIDYDRLLYTIGWTASPFASKTPSPCSPSRRAAPEFTWTGTLLQSAPMAPNLIQVMSSLDFHDPINMSSNIPVIFQSYSNTMSSLD